MNPYDTILTQSPLFSGISPDDLHSMLDCLSAIRRSYPKGASIRRRGERLSSLGIVLDGSVHIAKEDYWGNSNLIAQCLPGDIFGESYAVSPETPLDIAISAGTSAHILFLDFTKIRTVCSKTCPFHSRLVENLLYVLAAKNRNLNQKLEHVTKRSTREKLLSYLSSEAAQQGNADFTIPFNRQQLADYLSVDRSAMSSALSALKAEGVLSYHKNHFILL